MRTRLRTFIFATALGAAVICCAAGSALLYYTSTYLATSVARQASLQVADAAFACTLAVMTQGLGKEELETRAGEECSVTFGESAAPATDYGVTILGVASLTKAEVASDPLLAAALEARDTRVQQDGDRVRVLYAARATEQCEGCHMFSEPGEPLGFVDVRHDISPELRRPRTLAFLLGLLLFPIGLGGALAAARILDSRIARSLSHVDRELETLADAAVTASAATTTTSQTDFSEFDELNTQVRSQLDRATRSLRLRSQALAAMMISGDAARDWLHEMERLVGDLYRVVPFDALAVFFCRPDGPPELRIWWTGSPAGESGNEVEASIRTALRNEIGVDPMAGVETSRITEAADAGTTQPDLAQLRTALVQQVLPRNAVGGVRAAVMVPRTGVEDRATLEGLLPPLINTAGALRALDDHTRRLEFNATRDPLTGLFNQRAFWDLLQYDIHRAQRRNASLSLVVLDFDGFKLINDTYGHDFGDDFLRAASAEMRAQLRATDVLARTGGDEFAIITFGAGTEQAYLVATRLVKAFQVFQIDAPDGKTVGSTVSVGISVHPDHAESAQQLFKLADSQMYKAKSAGRNRVSLPEADDLSASLDTDSERLATIRRALEQDTVVPYFQPLLGVQTGRIVAHEVLMRIREGDQVIPAGEIVEIAETVGLITNLDLVVIRKALAHASEVGYRGRLLINLSPKALVYESFMAEVTTLVSSSRISPSQIVFELTERDTVRNVTLLEGFVKRLQTEGFGFAIDDFGAGFSSLQYLRRLPVEILKIDGEFVRNITQDGADLAIVTAVATLARGLGIETVGEFVEDAETLALMGQLGIDYAQGWHVGRPAADFADGSER